GLALGRGRSLQEAATAAAGRALPASPYAAGAVAFTRSVVSGSKISDAALSASGKTLVGAMHRRGIRDGLVGAAPS
ncbi:MAG: hypothetical protein ACREXY_01980, partial [Gammaproteobacteria bacterium]